MDDQDAAEEAEILRAQVGTRMRMVRKTADVTQEEAGEICGVSGRTYRNYETGQSVVPIDVLIRFCRGFKTSSDDLLLGRQVSGTSKGQGALVDEIAAGLLEAFGRPADEADRSKQIRMARYAFESARAKGRSFSEELAEVSGLMG